MPKLKNRGSRHASITAATSTPAAIAAPLRVDLSTQASASGFKSPLARVLDAPDLPTVVPHMAPETLYQLIRHAGLDACGDLVAAATPAQLTSILDLDLWRHAQPGRDEQFDADRFGEWLEVLMDTGSTDAARIVAALDEHLVIAGLSRYVRVIDPGTLEPTEQTDDEPMGPVLFDGPHPTADQSEIGGYMVQARRADAWDAVVSLLVALDADHPETFHAVMQGCRQLSNSAPEVDGLDDLLMEPEQLMHDVALDRGQRRSQQGYATPADARAFLQMARRPRSDGSARTSSINPIAAAYFRSADEMVASVDRRAGAPRAGEPPMSPAASASIDAMAGLLADAGLVPERPRALLGGTVPHPSRLAHMRRLMDHLRDRDINAYLTRSRELAFLANTLMAGCSVQSRPLTPQEASEAAVGACNLGLEHWPARWPARPARGGLSTVDSTGAMPDAFLVDHDLVTAFEVGWAVLHEDVSLFVASHLIATLKELLSVDVDIRRGLKALRRELVRQRDAGTPWGARDALEVIAMLDMPAWVSLRGLLDECPVLPATLTATLEGHRGAVSATAFEFISTTSQICVVHAFMGKLLGVLQE